MLYSKNLVEKTLLSLVTSDKAEEILASLKSKSKKGKTGEKKSGKTVLKYKTIELIKEKPLTIDEVVSELLKIPDVAKNYVTASDKETLRTTTKRRLNKEEIKNIKIIHDDDGKYSTTSKLSWVKSEKPAPEKTEKPVTELQVKTA